MRLMSSTIVRPAAESFVIEGGHPLSGRVRASGNKNGALPILAACLLTDEPVTLSNLPRIRDVETMTDHLAAQPWLTLGARGVTRFAELVRPLARAAAASMPQATPIGLPDAPDL